MAALLSVGTGLVLPVAQQQQRSQRVAASAAPARAQGTAALTQRLTSRSASLREASVSMRRGPARTVAVRVAASGSSGSAAVAPSSNPLSGFFAKYPKAETAIYFAFWYLLNVKFNILNKQIYNFFPFPWFVSCVHLVVGLIVMSVFWATKVVPFEKPDEAFLKDVTLPAFLHAFGHCLTNVSFAAVAVSFTHTIKTLEPVFSALGVFLISGTVYPLPVYAALVPIMAGVALASATEMSFTWLGFLTAMSSNAAFAGRAIFSKNLMNRMSAVNLYNYVTILALLFCIPPTLYFEGASLAAGLKAAAAKVGAKELGIMLFNVGLYYHLYNQVAYQALEKVEPITHAVGNVGKRIFVIGFSILAFGNSISTQTAVGSAIAIFGTGLYSYLKAQTAGGKH